MRTPLFAGIFFSVFAVTATAAAQYTPLPPPPQPAAPPQGYYNPPPPSGPPAGYGGAPAPGYGYNAYNAAPRRERFGSTGQLVISSDANVSFIGCSNCGVASTNGPGTISTGGTDSSWQFTLAPSVDYFVMQGLSLGAEVLFQHINYSVNEGAGVSNAVDINVFGIGGRVGYNIPISDQFSFWPKGGLLFSTASAAQGGPSESTFDVVLYGPFLWHLAPHFFVGLGPYLQSDLTTSNNLPKSTYYGLMFTVGGWFTPGT